MKTPRLETLVQRRAELDAQISRCNAREREEQRKRETRQKIIVGGIVLAAAEKEPGLLRWLVEKVQALPREADRALFADVAALHPENANVA